MSNETRICNRCLEEKSLEAFSINGTRRKRTCKSCIAEQWRLWHGDKKQAEKERRENQQFNQLMASWLPPGKISQRQTHE